MPVFLIKLWVNGKNIFYQISADESNESYELTCWPLCFSATGSWKEQENPHANRITALINYHKILASIEKQQKERKKFQTKRTFLQFVRTSLNSLKLCKNLSLQQSFRYITGEIWNHLGNGSQTFWST